MAKLSERQQFFADFILSSFHQTRNSTIPCMLYMINHKFSVTASNVRSDGIAGNRACGDFTEHNMW